PPRGRAPPSARSRHRSARRERQEVQSEFRQGPTSLALALREALEDTCVFPERCGSGLSVQRDVEVRPLQEQTESVDFLLDAYRAGKLSRREFVRRGLALGLTMSAATGLLAEAASAATRAVEQARAKPGGTLREGYDLDFTRMDPINTNW